MLFEYCHIYLLSSSCIRDKHSYIAFNFLESTSIFPKSNVPKLVITFSLIPGVGHVPLFGAFVRAQVCWCSECGQAARTEQVGAGSP